MGGPGEVPVPKRRLAGAPEISPAPVGCSVVVSRGQVTTRKMHQATEA